MTSASGWQMAPADTLGPSLGLEPPRPLPPSGLEPVPLSGPSTRAPRRAGPERTPRREQGNQQATAGRRAGGDDGAALPVRGGGLRPIRSPVQEPSPADASRLAWRRALADAVTAW
jgi:hypothetical protein